MRFRILTVIIMAILLSFSIINAVPKNSDKYYGTATATYVGDVIVAYINDVASGNITVTTAGQYGCFDSSGVLLTCSDGSTSNVLSVSGDSGDTIIFKLGNTNCGSTTFTEGGLTRKNLDCTIGGAVTGVTGAVGGGGAAGAPAAAVVAPPTEVLTEVTNPSIISDVKQSLPAGWTNIQVQQVDTTTTKTTTSSTAIVDNALSFATDPDAISALQNLKSAIASGELSGLSVTTTLSIFKVTNKDTGEIEYRTQIHLIFSAPDNMKDIKVIETIPKEMANSINDIIFVGEKPTNILQEDPIVEWIISSLAKGETKDLSYIIKKKITEIKSITTAAGVKVEVAPPPPPPPEEKPKPKIFTTEVIIGISIMILIVLIGLLIYFAVTRKKRE